MWLCQIGRKRQDFNLTPFFLAPIIVGMEVHLSPKQESQLNELATTTGRGTDELVQEAVERLLAYNNSFKEQVQVGLDQVKRGEFVEDEEVRGRIDRMFRP